MRTLRHPWPRAMLQNEPNAPGRTGMDRTHSNDPTTRAHGNGPNTPERSRRLPGCTGMATRISPRAKREKTESTRRHPGRTGMNRTHPNESHCARESQPCDSKGDRELTKRTRKNPTTARERRNRPNAPEPTGRTRGRTPDEPPVVRE